jgi:hypothetical protein
MNRRRFLTTAAMTLAATQVMRRSVKAATTMAYAKKFTGKYEHRLIEGGIGHNLPQEAPKAFAQAVIDVDHF